MSINFFEYWASIQFSMMGNIIFFKLTSVVKMETEVGLGFQLVLCVLRCSCMLVFLTLRFHVYSLVSMLWNYNDFGFTIQFINHSLPLTNNFHDKVTSDSFLFFSIFLWFWFPGQSVINTKTTYQGKDGDFYISMIHVA